MKKNSIAVVFTALLFVVGFSVSPAVAAPPASYEVGTLVFMDLSSFPSHLIQFPGSPVDCTDNFHSDWCFWSNCDTLSSSTYSCENIPMVFTCLAFQISAGEIQKVINVDSDGCK